MQGKSFMAGCWGGNAAAARSASGFRASLLGCAGVAALWFGLSVAPGEALAQAGKTCLLDVTANPTSVVSNLNWNNASAVTSVSGGGASGTANAVTGPYIN